jgi:hypothetical protein
MQDSMVFDKRLGQRASLPLATLAVATLPSIEE